MEQLLNGAQLGIPPHEWRLQPIDPLGTAHPSQHPGSLP